MRAFQEYVAAVVKYIDTHGKTQGVIDKVESMLPGVWAAEIIAEALDAIETR